MSTETPLDEILSAFRFRKTAIACERFEHFINQSITRKGGNVVASALWSVV